MRRLTTMALVLAAMGCNEINIYEGLQLEGDGDPPNLDSPTKTDTIVQVTKPQVDVLWVVDNSCSMIEEQQNLAENFSAFIEFFLDSGLDWHIGLVSTDTEDSNHKGKLQGAGGYKYLTPQVPSPIALFAQIAQLGTSGSYTERGLRAAQWALQPPSQDVARNNRGFYREEAALHIIAISDEEDQSSPNPTRNEFITFLRDLKEDEDTPVTFSSIVGPAPNGCSGGDGDADYGGNYIAVTNAVGGIHESICEEEWTPLLEELGLQAAGLRREYFLSEVPVPSTVEVWVVDGDVYYDGILKSEIPEGKTAGEICASEGLTNCFPFEYNKQRNSVIMSEFVPSPLAEINIKYDLLRGRQDDLSDEDLGGGAIDTGI